MIKLIIVLTFFIRKRYNKKRKKNTTLAKEQHKCWLRMKNFGSGGLLYHAIIISMCDVKVNKVKSKIFKKKKKKNPIKFYNAHEMIIT